MGKCNTYESFINGMFRLCYEGDETKKDQVAGRVERMGNIRNSYKVSLESFKRREH
jgi:hypothetical protein